MSAAIDINVRGALHDTQVLAHVVTAGDELTYGLKPLSKKYLEYPDDDEKILEDAVKIARAEAKARGYLIAGGRKEVDRGDHCVFAGNKPVKADYWLAPPDLCDQYLRGDVTRTMLLFLMWWDELKENPRAKLTYFREMMLFHSLRRMELRGTRVYPSHNTHLIGWYDQYMVMQRKIADRIGGAGMNFNSPKQLTQKFYIERGIPPMFTPRGLAILESIGYTPNQFEDPNFLDELQQLPEDPIWGNVWKKVRQSMTLGKDQLAVLGATDQDTGEYKDPLAKAILEWRAAKQSKTAFLNIYARFWYPTTDQFGSRYTDFTAAPTRGVVSDTRIIKKRWNYKRGVWILHPNYNQTGAVTGRMTCSDPNLQQVASATTGLRKADIPARPRESFGPRPGCVWYLPDYSQIEVWLFAFLSGTQKMKDQLLSGHDFHAAIAEISFGHRPDYKAKKKYYRKLAKLIMFGKLYGGGVGTPERPGRMTKLLQMPFDEAKEFIDSFEAQFREVVLYMKDMVRQAKRDKEAFNLFGRRYRLGTEWAYKVVNYLIQGTAADMLKNATVRLDWMLTHRWPHPLLGLLNTIHDEMMIEVPLELHSIQLMREICWVMQMDTARAGIPVPLPVGMKMTKKLYSVREHRIIQRWADTTDVAIRPPHIVEYWKARGKVPHGEEGEERFASMLGGVPFLKEEREEFADLEAFMKDCPFERLLDDTALTAA